MRSAKKIIPIFIFYFLIFLFFLPLNQGCKTSSKSKSLQETEQKQKQRQKEEDAKYQKAVKQHLKHQTKETRKRMKTNKKIAQGNTYAKKECFLKRWFGKKKGSCQQNVQ